VALTREASKSGFYLQTIAGFTSDPDGDGLLYTNTGQFAFQALPETYDSTGLNKFIVNEAGVIYGQDFGDAAAIGAWPGANPTTAGWRVVQ